MPTRERAAALREALGLWRGTPLSDLAYWSFAQDTIRNLEEQRVNAQQMLLEAELELGLHREAIGELDALVREHPTHERLRWLQMLALHRSDRRQDALAAYQEARLAIVEESGMEPGEELRALQRRILQDDPTPHARRRSGGGGCRALRSSSCGRSSRCASSSSLVDEELDVEAARGVVSRGLASLEEIVLRHGGTVEQLLGEEAVAVFGLPGRARGRCPAGAAVGGRASGRGGRAHDPGGGGDRRGARRRRTAAPSRAARSRPRVA